MIEAVTLPGLKLSSSGKVRELYDLDDSLLLVASDRISAYDVVLSEPIPDKGKVLTGLSAFWFKATEIICRNHLISTDLKDFPSQFKEHGAKLAGRSMLCQKLDIFPVECVVRGYLSGSGWREYQRDGTVCGIELPSGLQESERLPEPIFTPATKAELGQHDENIDANRAIEILGSTETFDQLRELSLELYGFAVEHAASRSIILADTKFEFGRDSGGRIVLADELFTPDSSRFWPADQYSPGHTQPSFDKQFVRDWLDSTGWDHSPPAPRLPADVIEKTREKYIQAYEEITGEGFEEWLKR